MRKLVTVQGGDSQVYDDVDTNKPTGFASVDAVLFTRCLRCKSEPRFVCRTPSGKKSKTVHKERIDAIGGAAIVKLTNPAEVLSIPGYYVNGQAEKDAKKLFKEMKKILGDLF